ncbi:MAG TPA: phosphodiester glycosidase family protein [Terriglobales bacterium]|nr:phosphodiester glycosidase family protein [Terriglobales bacterium]
MTSAPRHVPVGRIAIAAAVALGVFMLLRAPGRPIWRSAAPGLEFALLDGGHWCRRGSANVAVLRLDPERVAVRVHHCLQREDPRPLDIVGWQRALGAAAVFNAGQYYPDLSYMGLLVSGGKTLSGRLHPTFQAALVAGPVTGGGGAHVLDLQRHPLDPVAPGWREVAQSFMLIDEDGSVRVRKSDKVANRTAVAEDRHGHLLVVVSEGGYTLWDFAEMLQRLPLEVDHAMSMDGGDEAQLVVRTRDLRYASFGRWERDGDEAAAATAGTPLPAVIELSPR